MKEIVFYVTYVVENEDCGGGLAYVAWETEVKERIAKALDRPIDEIFVEEI